MAAAHLILLLGVAAASAAGIGGKAPDFALPDAQGQIHKLSDYRGTVVVLEWTNPDCPFVQRHYREGSMKSLAASCRDSGVVWLAVNSTGYNTPEDTQRWTASHGLPYTTLLDADGSVGALYGAKTTPFLVLVSSLGNLVYAGAVDDDPDGAKLPSERALYIEAAIRSALHGEAPSLSATTPYGCPIKYPH
jgi:peroxiredoxin